MNAGGHCWHPRVAARARLAPAPAPSGTRSASGDSQSLQFPCFLMSKQVGLRTL